MWVFAGFQAKDATAARNCAGVNRTKGGGM
ncbi:hypothetical protein OPKNFCMD_5709 [Methylobacterium crusticola]|uniref:Uncharacterized protein n=1 Tax=Methylobacterium crusticola TaxID=1697972 RepID=A0ABQ4R840_9HYPH|nr:hypothetical protein OPKNFCMD_5709 [Methylobacterium crusticola]